MPTDAQIGEPIESVMLARGRHSMYVDDGLVTDAIDGHTYSLDMLILVIDAERWSTLHRLNGIWRGGGRRRLNIGPRIPWPDGSVRARRVPDDAYEEALAGIDTSEGMSQ